MTHQCPVCKKSYTYDLDGQDRCLGCFPFCSERCKLIDLGAWLDTDYKIAVRPDPSCPDLTGDDVWDHGVY